MRATHLEPLTSDDMKLEKVTNKVRGNLCLVALNDQSNTELKTVNVPVLQSGQDTEENYTAKYPQWSQTAQNYLKTKNAVVHVVLDSIEPQTLVNEGMISQDMALRHGAKPVSTSGTGFFITPDGWLVTNNHLACLTNDIKAQWPDGSRVRLRKMYSDPESDLALLKIDCPRPVYLPFLPLANDDSMDKINSVTMVGYPNCWKNLHCSPGNKVGLGHTSDYFNAPMHKTIKSIKSNARIIKTDCHSAPGGSGSPLLNDAGEVVGVNFAGPAPEDGPIATRCSFAMPVRELRNAIKHIPELRYRFGL